MLDLSAGYISRTLGEDAKKRLSIDVVWQIARIFSVNIDDLLNAKLSEPLDTTKPVTAFFEKLKRDTANHKIQWRNCGPKDDNADSFVLFDHCDKPDFGEPVYNPLGEASYSLRYYVRDDIYSTYLRGRKLYVVPVRDIISGVEGVEVYTYLDDEEAYMDEPDRMSRICSTPDDSTGYLNEKGEQLLNSIKQHEKDFMISQDAKSFIESYLNPHNMTYSDCDDLPFN